MESRMADVLPVCVLEVGQVPLREAYFLVLVEVLQEPLVDRVQVDDDERVQAGVCGAVRQWCCAICTGSGRSVCPGRHHLAIRRSPTIPTT